MEAPISRPKPRSLVMLRSETPSDAAQFTRSGRTSVKPVAFWRNERVVYTGAKSDGKRLSLPGIKEVIRTEEVDNPRPQAGKKRGPRKRVEESIEEVDEDEEPWEEDPGVLQADVMQWDPLTERSLEDNLEQIGWCCSFLHRLSPACLGSGVSMTNDGSKQSWPFRPRALRSSPKKSRTRASSTPRQSRCLSSTRAWWTFPRPAKSESKTRAATTWSFGYFRGVSWSMSVGTHSALGEVGCGRSREVSEKLDQLMAFLCPFHPSKIVIQLAGCLHSVLTLQSRARRKLIQSQESLPDPSAHLLRAGMLYGGAGN